MFRQINKLMSDVGTGQQLGIASPLQAELKS
jgi:hypothetical protein